MSAKYKLSVTGSKAVQQADIELDSITVLTGINASGKSTLARMMHQIVNLSSCYPLLLERMCWGSLRTWSEQIVVLKDRLNLAPGGTLLLGGISTEGKRFNDELGRGEFSKVVNGLDSYTQEVFALYREKAGGGDAKRALGAFSRAVGIGEELAYDVDRIYDIFREKAAACQRRYKECLNTRNYAAYNYATLMNYDIRWLTEAEKVIFTEDGEAVYAVHESRDHHLFPDSDLKEIFGLRHSFYIASPWVGMPQLKRNGCLTIRYDDFEHYPVPNGNGGGELPGLFNVMGGIVESDETTGRQKWIFRPDKGGEGFDLNDCATGIKALSILNILYTRGYLNQETLLIIDEPEAHLHPQWIVEYARILVRIAKFRKVRMLLTSHNPDMVAALQEISSRDGLSGVRFYLAEKSGNDGYVYRSLGTDIEPIFKAFNKALDEIEMYESANGETHDDHSR